MRIDSSVLNSREDELEPLRKRITELEAENKRLYSLYAWARAIFDMARTTCTCRIRWVECVEHIDLMYKPKFSKEQAS